MIRTIVTACSDLLNANNSGYIGRLGGEEFVILLSKIGRTEARTIADQLRECIAQTPIPLDEHTIHSATVSIGLASLQHTEAFDELLHRADLAMYQAKKAGRNQVATWRDTVAG